MLSAYTPGQHKSVLRAQQLSGLCLSEKCRAPDLCMWPLVYWIVRLVCQCFCVSIEGWCYSCGAVRISDAIWIYCGTTDELINTNQGEKKSVLAFANILPSSQVSFYLHTDIHISSRRNFVHVS